VDEAKMKGNKDDVLNSNAEQGSTFAARRTIIKGLTSAVPVVLTVGCGKALANASSLQCVKDPEPGSAPPEYITAEELDAETPPWVREKVEVPTSGGPEKEIRYKLVYVDQDGKHYNNDTPNSSPVTHSCYASFL
jgi:hypothetical protein